MEDGHVNQKSPHSMSTMRRQTQYSAATIATHSYTELQSNFNAYDQKWWIISINNELVGMWEALILLFVFYNAVFLPYSVAFADLNSTPTWVVVCDTVADYLFIIDLVVNFFKAYEGDRGEIVIDPKRVRSNYLAFWFWIDFPSCIPLDIFFPNLTYVGFLRCIRLLRTGRLIKAMEKLQYANIWNILRLVCGFGSLTHWLGCMWWLTVSKDGAVDEYSTVVSSTYVRAEVGGSDFQPWVSTHVVNTEKTNETAYYRWLVTFYSALCMLLGENIEPVESIELWVHISALLLGAI